MERRPVLEDSMSRTLTSSVLAALFAFAVPAAAADADALAAPVTSAEAAVVDAVGDVDWSLPPVHLGGAKRGSLLPSLYVGLAGLNAFDAYSTNRGLSQGAIEANPLMRAATGNPATVWAVKAGVTAVSITLAERLWRQHRRGSAIAVMVISNGMMAVVAARNASVIRAQR
jgi:uncharacterized protein DUF5658